METTKLQLVLSEPTVPVPDTGRFVGLGSGTSQNIIITLAVVAVCLAVVGLIVYRVSRKSGRFSASDKSAFSLSRKNSLIRKFGLGMFVMVAIGVVAGLGAKVGKSFAADNYAAISVPEIVEMEGEISEATFVSGKLTVTMQDAASYGYDLYALAGGDLYFIPETEDNETVIAPISEQGALSANTWGFTLDADAKASDEAWYPLSDVATLVESYGEATAADNKTDIYFGVLVDDSVLADTYTLDVDFYSIAALANTFEQAFAAANVSKYNDTDYYAMQSMTTSICSDVITPAATVAAVPEIQLIDTRDSSVYWVAKLADGGCWMTQNLDLLIDSSKTYTHEDTDLGWSDGTTTAVWTPNSTLATVVTIGEEDTSEGENVYVVYNWSEDNKVPYQMEGGSRYNGYSSLAGCMSSGYTETQCEHYHDGNYYNWSAVVAENDTSSITANYTVMPNSICPAGWRLPNGLVNNNGTIIPTDYNTMFYKNNIATSLTTSQDVPVGIVSGNEKKLGSEPVYFARSGQVYGGYVDWGGTNGYYWTSTASSSNYAYLMSFSWNSNGATGLSPARGSSRYYGRSVRCLAR